MYHCKKCKHKHREDSTIGKKHQKYKLKEAMYYCSECDHQHRISSNIGEEHFEYFKEKEEKKEKQRSLESVVEKPQGKATETSVNLPTELPIDFERVKKMEGEEYIPVPHVRSKIFDSKGSGEIMLISEEIKKKKEVKIDELPASILFKEKDLLNKAKEEELPFFAVEIITEEGERFYELEVDTYDLLLYKKR